MKYILLLTLITDGSFDKVMQFAVFDDQKSCIEHGELIAQMASTLKIEWKCIRK